MENFQAGPKIEKEARKEQAASTSKAHAQEWPTHKIVPGTSNYFEFNRDDPSLFFDGLSSGYVILDVKGVIKNANQAAAEMLGIEKRHLINRDFSAFVHEEDHEHLRFGEKYISEHTHPCFDIRLKKKQDFFWARVNVSIDKNPYCPSAQIWLILCNINDLKQEEQEKTDLMRQLQQTQKMEAIGVLSSGIAHDFNNILQPIIGSLEIMIEDAACDWKLQKTLKNVLAGADRAGNLVRQILNFSHQADLTVGPIKIQPIIREILKLSRSTLPANIKIIRTIDNECGPVVADPTHIYQIAMNLITNAFHAMGQDDGTLDVKLKEVELTGNLLDGLALPPGIYVCLSVADTGEGISDSIMSNIFDPYFTTKEEGTGLGLCVISDIVKKYGGDISFRSESGRGSLFRVYFPRGTVPFDAIQDVKDKQKDLYGNESILFVDDDPFIVEVQHETFERCGYNVTSFVNSLDALNEFKARSMDFDIVLCDMTMPGMTGLVLAEKIKKIRSDIPIIICTGFSEQINQDSYHEMGVDGFLTKPAIKEEYLKQIRNLLDSK